MYDVIGHEDLRKRLGGVSAPFAILGPPGVGKRGIVHEWARDDEVLSYTFLHTEQARYLAERSYRSPMIVLLDGDGVLNWDPLLKPIEDGYLAPAIYATKLPETILSRVRVFRTGGLSDAEVSKVLARDFPRYGPRPWLTTSLGGTLHDIGRTRDAIQHFEEVEASVASRTFPVSLIRENPVEVLYLIRLLCLARLGSPNLPWSKASLAVVPEDIAKEVLLGASPFLFHEARNVATVFFAGVTGGRLG